MLYSKDILISIEYNCPHIISLFLLCFYTHHFDLFLLIGEAWRYLGEDLVEDYLDPTILPNPWGVLKQSKNYLKKFMSRKGPTRINRTEGPSGQYHRLHPMSRGKPHANKRVKLHHTIRHKKRRSRRRAYRRRPKTWKSLKAPRGTPFGRYLFTTFPFYKFGRATASSTPITLNLNDVNNPDPAAGSWTARWFKSLLGPETDNSTPYFKYTCYKVRLNIHMWNHAP